VKTFFQKEEEYGGWGWGLSEASPTAGDQGAFGRASNRRFRLMQERPYLYGIVYNHPSRGAERTEIPWLMKKTIISDSI
jgi:hypothetical protein